MIISVPTPCSALNKNTRLLKTLDYFHCYATLVNHKEDATRRATMKGNSLKHGTYLTELGLQSKLDETNRLKCAVRPKGNSLTQLEDTIDSICHSARIPANHADKIWQDQLDSLHCIKMTPSEVNDKCAKFYSLILIHLNS